MSKLYTLIKELNDFNGEPSPELTAWFEENGWTLGTEPDHISEYLWVWGSKTSEYTLEGRSIETVHEWGGEGQGDSRGYIYKHGDDYVRVTGHYSSWEGTDWSYGSVDEVEPREVTVTKYFAV